MADFGSAKILDADHVSMSYICSRYYRAPELLMGSTNYTTKIVCSWHFADGYLRCTRTYGLQDVF